MSGILAGLLNPPERRFHVSQTPPGWIDNVAGWETATGKSVTPETALNLSAVFACVRVLAEDAAALPLIVYRRMDDDGKERAVDHYLYPLLHDAPNPEMTSYTFRETLMGHVLTWGNAYAEIEINRAGEVAALWPLRPDRMAVKRVRGRLEYTYQLPKPDAQGRLEVKLTPEQVLHLRGLGFDGIMGYSVISMARQAIGLGLGAEEFGGRFFANGARPGMVLKHPGKLGDEAYKRLQGSWEDRHQGLEHAHRIAILEEGLEIEEIGIPYEDARFLATRKFQVVEVCRFYRVPPHKVAELERATFSNIEHQSIEYVTGSLMPWLVRWEQEISRCLLLGSERGRIFAEHLVAGLLRGDIGSRYSAYATGRQNGWLSANDIRRLENMNPIDGGDVYLVPLNMVPADEVGLGRMGTESDTDSHGLHGLEMTVSTGGGSDRIPALGAPTPGGDRTSSAGGGPGHHGGGDSSTPLRSARNDGGGRGRTAGVGRHRLARVHFRVYRDVAARVLRREVNDVGNAARRMLGGQRDAQSFSLWLGEFYREHPEFVTRNFAPLAGSYGELVAADAQEEIGAEAEFSPELERWVRAYVEAFGARHSGISEARVRAALEDALDGGGDLLEAVEGELDGWEEDRGEETARWETVRFCNAVAVAVFTFGGILYKRWATVGDNCPFCNGLDGQVVGISRFFIDAGTDLTDGDGGVMHIGHNVGHPPAHDGCDCMVVAG